jgi:hypothetical protein
VHTSGGRGIWLTGFLLIAAANQVLNLGLLGSNVQKAGLVLNLSLWQVHLLVALEVAQLVALGLIWLRSKSGVLAYVALSVAFTALQKLHGGNINWLIVAATVALLVLCYPHWSAMTWGIQVRRSQAT